MVFLKEFFEKADFEKIQRRQKILQNILIGKELTLNAPIATKSHLLFSSTEMFKKPLWQTKWNQIRLLL